MLKTTNRSGCFLCCEFKEARLEATKYALSERNRTHASVVHIRGESISNRLEQMEEIWGRSEVELSPTSKTVCPPAILTHSRLEWRLLNRLRPLLRTGS